MIYFFYNDTATTEIYTLSLHDALPIWKTLLMASSVRLKPLNCSRLPCVYAQETQGKRSEERFSRNAETDLVCRLLLEKKKKSKKWKKKTKKYGLLLANKSKNNASTLRG